MEGRDLQYDTCLSPTSARDGLYLADGTELLMKWGQAEARSEVAVRVEVGKAETYLGIRCSNPFFLTQSSDLGLKVKDLLFIWLHMELLLFHDFLMAGVPLNCKQFPCDSCIWGWYILVTWNLHLVIQSSTLQLSSEKQMDQAGHKKTDFPFHRGCRLSCKNSKVSVWPGIHGAGFFASGWGGAEEQFLGWGGAGREQNPWGWAGQQLNLGRGLAGQSSGPGRQPFLPGPGRGVHPW